MMNDLDRIKRNVAKMAAQNAPESDIDGYIASEGVTVEQVRQHKLGAAQSPAAAEPSFFERAGDYFGGIMGQVEQGATFGLADEVGAAGAATAAAMKAPFRGQDIGETFTRRYGEKLGEIRGQNEDFFEENPVASVGAQVVSGITSAPTKAIGALEAFPRWLRAIGGGAALGGAYGFGAGEGGAGERAESAATGAAFGGGTAGVAYPIGRLVRYGADKTGLSVIPELVRNRMDPERAARGQIARAMVQDNMTPSRVAGRMDRLGPQATLADAGGENLQGVARAAASVPGPAKNRAGIVLNNRAEGETARIARTVEDVVSPDDFYTLHRTTSDSLKGSSFPVYEAAYQANPVVASPRVSEILESPAGKSAYRKALTTIRDLAASDGVPAPGEMSLAVLDKTKQILGDMGSAAARQGRGANSRAAYRLARSLADELDAADATGNYAAARKIYGDDAEVLGALEMGQKYGNKAPEIIEKEIAELSDAGRAAYRAGVARSVLDVAERTGDTASAARRIFGNQASRNRLRAAIGDDAAYNRLARVMNAEQKFAQTKNRVLGGSPTRRIGPEQEALGQTAGRIGAIFGPNVLPGQSLVAAGVGRQIARGVARATPNTSNAISRLMFSRGGLGAEDLAAIEKAYGRAARAEAERNTIGPILRGIIQQEGIQMSPDANLPGLLSAR